MALTTVSFTTAFDYTNNVFNFTDTTDYSGQSVNTLVANIPDVIGNFKITDPNGNVIWNNQNYSIETGQAQSISGSSIVLGISSTPPNSIASTTDNYYDYLYCFLSAGTGSPQNRRVTNYVGSTKSATVSPAWTGVGGSPTYRFTFGDIVPAGSTSNQISVGLSLGQDGYPIAGTYTIIYTVKWDIAGTAQYTTSTVSFDFDFVPPVIELGSSVDCLIPQLIASDNTNYVVDGITPTITRTHTLYNPPSIGGSITGTAADLATASFYAPASYQHTLSVVLSYTLTDGTVVTMTLTGNQTIQVTCDHKLCDIYCCVRTLWNNYNSYRQTNPTLAQQYLVKLTQVASLMTLINQAYECSQGDTVDSYVDEILRISNCEAGCGCQDDTPIPVTGLGGGGSTTVVSQGNGITVTSSTTGGTTTYVVNISQSILNQIASIQAVTVVGAVSNTVVESPTGTWTVTGASVTEAADTQLPTTTSIDVTPTTVGGIDTVYTVKYVGRNYKLLHNYAPTTPATTLSANDEIVPAGGGYPMIAPVVSTAGDIVRCKLVVGMVSTALNSTVRIRIGGLTGQVIFTAAPIFTATNKGYNRFSAVVEVHRISATSARVVSELIPQNYFFGLVNALSSGGVYSSSIVAVPNFDSGTNVWCVTVDDATLGQTEVRNFSLEFIPKV